MELNFLMFKIPWPASHCWFCFDYTLLVRHEFGKVELTVNGQL